MGTATTPLPRDPAAVAAVERLLDSWWGDASTEDKIAAYDATHGQRRGRRGGPTTGQLALDTAGG